MISWMQKNNKFLVWTIWIATISFIGTGASMGLSGSSTPAGAVAKVGEVTITQTQLNMVYSNIYNQYNEAMQGKLDEEKAKEMGLIKQAFKDSLPKPKS
ncbi:MAG: SurA N-terminal domain-containing protein [Sulfurovum sp.]|nr:SurA N-terminal domain-containing protein [Sulfurovum sp.]